MDSLPTEKRRQLERLVDLQQITREARGIVATFELLNDPDYLVSLLDDADPRDFVRIVRRLEKSVRSEAGHESRGLESVGQRKSGGESGENAAGMSGVDRERPTSPRLSQRRLGTSTTNPEQRCSAGNQPRARKRTEVHLQRCACPRRSGYGCADL